jgi:hypothetical protein
MKKNREIFNIYLSIVASVGSALALLIVSTDKSSIDNLLNFRTLDIKELTPILISLISLFIGLFTYLFSKRLKARRKRIFMIYAHKDKEKAKLIQSEFRKYTGIQIQSDDEVINIGDNIRDEIKKQIEYSDNVIIILSKNTNESDWIKKEIEIAKERNIKIIPIIIDDSKPPKELDDLKYANIDEVNKETIFPIYKSIRDR